MCDNIKARDQYQYTHSKSLTHKGNDCGFQIPTGTIKLNVQATEMIKLNVHSTGMLKLNVHPTGMIKLNVHTTGMIKLNVQATGMHVYFVCFGRYVKSLVLACESGYEASKHSNRKSPFL